MTRKHKTVIRHEYFLIEKFVGYYGNYASLQITCTGNPDMVPESSGEIDAVAIGPKIKLAIEHTSTDVIPDQRTYDRRYTRFAKIVRDSIEGKFGFNLDVTLPSDITYSQEEASILIIWLLRQASSIPEGYGYHNVDGLSYRVFLQKEEALNAVFRIRRFAPENKPPQDSFMDQLNNKSQKLTRYISLGYRTILLLENNDIALMNRCKMERDVQYWKEHTPTIVPDELWYADTSIAEHPEFYPLNNFCN